MATALVSVQIIPKASSAEEVIGLVDEAIKIIDKSGVNYEVHPLETTMEGELEQLLAVIAEMNKKMIELGAPNVISQVKVLYQPEGITMGRLTEKYRQ
ncbi:MULTISPECIES: thiamine-binding protein [unclassified Bacillus (in: firmicutes)]|uniref:thiamine-binding protein n=1 Tax=unclassified Bacillus (in: firmicutes) TaxID=185979 RepID=UPI001BECB3C7|nr:MULTISPECIES: thiamine-binding protein [unclassified Bacillus (in: firmicutes)]MBT2639266.1 thiamine-binding protein [Bacillus sp. ISL-39]MBT2659803.1 thiamine-binding protein [Bacillus sp. ISL-45]